jgi:hypothetical protein
MTMEFSSWTHDCVDITLTTIVMTMEFSSWTHDCVDITLTTMQS